MPRSFKDTSGRDWKIDLNLGNVLRVKDAGFNLLAPNTPRPDRTDPLYLDLLADEALLTELLWTLLEPQGVALGVGRDTFLEQLTAGVLSTAWDALEAEWRDFFQQRRKAHLAELMAAMDRVAKEQMAQEATNAREMTLDKAVAIATAMAQKAGSSSTGSEKSGSLPEPSGLILGPSIDPASLSDASAGCSTATTEPAGSTPASSSPPSPTEP